ncbi:MAG: hypothetical protein KME30_00915 [Iphinoe sp. HA4291-MV1]|nr:hypothetical protein [Iphinoe sp. HA4291-MV1]
MTEYKPSNLPTIVRQTAIARILPTLFWKNRVLRSRGTEQPSRAWLGTRARSAIASQIAIALLCVSSPLVATSAAWAQQSVLNGEQQNTGSTAATLGQIAVPVLIQTLQGNRSQGNPNSGSVLDNIGREAVSAAVPALIQALQGGNNRSQQVSSNSNSTSDVGNIAEKATSAVPTLISSLQGTNSLLSLANAFVSVLTANDGSVIPSLIATLKSPDESVRLVAAYTLDKIGVGLQDKAKQLSSIDLDQAISLFDSAFKLVSNPTSKFPDDIIAGISNPLAFLKQERQDRSQQQPRQQQRQQQSQQQSQQQQ